MNKLLLKSIRLFNRAKNRHMMREYRDCISANHYARIAETKFFLRDYFLKSKYKVISYHGEFQQELTFVLPFAYWHYKNGTLKTTVSSKDTKHLYFFSEDHQEFYVEREWKGWNHSFDIPNTAHCNTFDYSKWLPVPLKERFRNDRYKFDKPILIIANKYNTEWGKPPINYFDIGTLDKLFNILKKNYQIVYNRPKSHHIVPDHSAIHELDELDWIKTHHPEIATFDELYENRPASVKSYNHLQLLVYANAEHFISVHGGTAALASYFGGTNIILSKVGFEHYFNEYQTIFPKLSGARILHAMDVDEVIQLATKIFLSNRSKVLETS